MPIPTDLLRKIRHIQFQTAYFAEDILAGAYRSTFRGRGMEFEEVREYQPGDEIRTIDWNVTARMQHPYVKSFHEERELTVTLIVDVSGSTFFGSGHQTKRELITEVAAVLAFSAIKNHDKVALLLFSEEVEIYYPPNRGTRHVLCIIRELLTHQPKFNRTNIGAALAFLAKVQKRSSICFLISDFISPDYSREAGLISKRHDLIPIAIYDRYERAFPNMQLVNLKDLETGELVLVDTSRDKNLKEITEEFDIHLEKQKQLMKKLGSNLIKLETNQAYLPQLKHFFKIRQKRG